MGAMDFQCGFGDETVYGTAPAMSRFFEYDKESIHATAGRTEGDPLRVGSGYARSDRFTPYIEGAAGSLDMAVTTKGFGFFLKHMLGTVTTTGPAEVVAYTHTGTEGSLLGRSLSMQLNRPFNPSGTNQPFLYRGGKITDWTLSNSVDGNLLLSLGLDFMQVDTATALATATYPTGMDNFTWAGGAITVGGTAFDLTEFSLKNTSGLAVDRRQIRANTDKKEPTASRREGSFSLKADFDTMAQRNRVVASTRAGALATLTAVWNGPTLLGTTLFPQVAVTVPAARFDEWKGSTESSDAISQELSGVVRYDAASSPITIAIRTADTAP